MKLADAAETGEDLAGRDRAVQNGARVVETRAFLGEHRQPRVDDLYDVIGSDREAAVGRAPHSGWTLRPVEADAQTIEGLDERRGRARTLSGLFHVFQRERA